jgi:hypothetical protein
MKQRCRRPKKAEAKVSQRYRTRRFKKNRAKTGGRQKGRQATTAVKEVNLGTLAGSGAKATSRSRERIRARSAPCSAKSFPDVIVRGVHFGPEQI